MPLASYPFLSVFWTMCIFFLFVIWIMILFRVFGDIFRRHDVGGGTKTLWVTLARSPKLSSTRSSRRRSLSIPRSDN